jgi:hypothetical protein
LDKPTKLSAIDDGQSQAGNFPAKVADFRVDSPVGWRFVGPVLLPNWGERIAACGHVAIVNQLGK